MKTRTKIAVAVIALLAMASAGIYVCLLRTCRSLQVIDAISTYSGQQVQVSAMTPRIVAIPVSDFEWAVRVTRGAPGKETVIAFAEFNERTSALTVHDKSYVPAKGPFSPTERAAICEFGNMGPLTEKEAQERTAILTGLSYDSKTIADDILLFNDNCGSDVAIDEVLRRHSVRAGWITENEPVVVFLILQEGLAPWCWNFSAERPPGDTPAAAGDIDIRTLKIAPGMID